MFYIVWLLLLICNLGVVLDIFVMGWFDGYFYVCGNGFMLLFNLFVMS